MRHAEVRAALGRYLDGELASVERRGVEEHLSTCSPCGVECRELRATLELLRGLPDPEPPPDLLPALLRRLESAPARRRGGLATRWYREIVQGPLPVPVAALAAGLVVLALVSPPGGWLFFLGSEQPRASGTREERMRDALSRTVEPRVKPRAEFPGEPARRGEPGSLGRSQAPGAAVAVAPPSERRAPSAPPVIISAEELEPVAMDPARGARATARRLVLPPGVAAAVAPGADAALPPRPALAACVASLAGPPSGASSAAEAGCRPWLQGMLTLAQYDPRGFLAEVEALPGPEAEAWLAELARFSHESRTSGSVVTRLRATPDARALEIARWFERAPSERAR